MLYNRSIPPDLADAMFRMGVGEFSLEIEESFERHLKELNDEAQAQRRNNIFNPDRFLFKYGRPKFKCHISRVTAANPVSDPDQRMR